jgi:hypothetical protein
MEDESRFTTDTEPGRTWESNKEEGLVYRKAKGRACRKDEEGDILISSNNLGNDDADPLVWQMAECVAGKFRENLGIEKTKGSYNISDQAMAERLFPRDDEWMFASDEDQEHATDDADKHKLPGPPSAVQVMRHSYIEMRQPTFNAESFLHYENIQIKFRGSVDKSLTPVTRCAHASPREYLAPLFAKAFTKLKPISWREDTMHNRLKPLKAAVKTLAAYAPYTLQDPWVMFFVRMFFGAAELEDILSRYPAIKTAEHWDDRSRDEFLYAYIFEFGEFEMRSVDRVQTTYMVCREWIGDHMESPEGKNKKGTKRKRRDLVNDAEDPSSAEKDIVTFVFDRDDIEDEDGE